MCDCIFCNLVRENKIFKVYEDNWTVAFMDIAKDVDGHILVVPKKHVKNILDCDTNTLCKLMDSVKKVSNHLVNNCGYDGVNLLNASDESAGQSVPHFHIHIIPRKNKDGIDAWPTFSGAKQELESLYEKIKM
jgi:histidine triad (HIT) family protein